MPIRAEEGKGGFGRSARALQPPLRSLLFYSCYIYSPRGDGYSAELSRRLCARLKLADPAWLALYAAQVRKLAIRDERFARLFARHATLVPVPGSSLSRSGSARAPWAAERLAFALYSVGLGGSLWTGVNRLFPVRKSATALNEQRPSVQQHYDSFAVVPPSSSITITTAAPRIVMVDDVITKGRTIFAAAARLQEAFPHADIRAFALVRTMGFLPDLRHPLEPCQGVVRWSGGDTRREP
jgi:hypothetical protein